MKINGLEFELTCGACPEQYDVLDESGKQVGYVRLRWGCFRVDYPEVGHKTVLEEPYGHEMCGEFVTDEDRLACLTRAADAIAQERKAKP